MDLKVGNAIASSSPPPISAPKHAVAATLTFAATPVPTTTPEQFVTITQPITIKIPYGTTVVLRGTKLPVQSRDAQTVRVRYVNAEYAIPTPSTGR
jgi:hypothetical protein